MPEGAGVFAKVEAFVRASIHGEAPGDEAFGELALEVFAWQVESQPMYRRLCELRGLRPGEVDHWTRIPAAPADLFKEGLVEPAEPAAVFLSSGTTAGSSRRSRHALARPSLDLYRASSMAHFASMVLPDDPGPCATLVLGPLASSHPHSSLGHMYGWAVERFADPSAVLQAFDAEGRLDLPAVLAWLEEAAAGTRPVLILALTSTITAVFEALRDRGRPLRLPADSRLVDTGGAKGGRTFSRAGILKAAWRFLHIPSYLCVGEYGMTELLSQFYDDALRRRWDGSLGPRRKRGPAWVRSVAVDPATLSPLPPGERGILRHVDLAGAAGVSAVQTLDIGVVFEEGRALEVSGRASDSEARGCSQLLSMVSAGETR